MNSTSITIISILSFLFIQGCHRNAQPVIHTPHDDGVKTFQEFSDSISQFPFSASIERRNIILRNYSKLTRGMSKKEVIELLGIPDFGEEMCAKESDRYIGSSWRYCFYLNKMNISNENLDTLINIFFDLNGKTHWITPSNIKGLNEIGGPGAS